LWRRTPLPLFSRIYQPRILVPQLDGIFTQILGSSHGSCVHLWPGLDFCWVMEFEDRCGPSASTAGSLKGRAARGRAESLRDRAESGSLRVPFSRFPWPCVERRSFADGRRTITNASLEVRNTAPTAVDGRTDRKTRSVPLLLGPDNRIRHVRRSPP
jgi:hypothetical protein